MTGNYLILGATSGIAKPLARHLAADKCNLLLAGRNAEAIEALADDLRVREGVEAAAIAFEATDFGSHPAFFQRCVEHFGGSLDGVVLCHGAMPTQEEAEQDFAKAKLMIDVNYASAVSLLNLAAAHFKEKGKGIICALSSVAGDRGRQSNVIYGSTKAALSAYLDGLRHRLYRHGVHVVTVKPGPTDTPMTRGMTGGPGPADPDKVAADIVRAMRKRKGTCYTPWKWRIIMAIVRNVPEFLFLRTKL